MPYQLYAGDVKARDIYPELKNIFTKKPLKWTMKNFNQQNLDYG